MQLIQKPNLYITDKELDKAVYASSSSSIRTEILNLIRTAFDLGVKAGRKDNSIEMQGQEGHLIYDL